MPLPVTATGSVSTVTLPGPLRVKVTVPVGETPFTRVAESDNDGGAVVPRVTVPVGLAVELRDGAALAIVTASAGPP